MGWKSCGVRSRAPQLRSPTENGCWGILRLACMRTLRSQERTSKGIKAASRRAWLLATSLAPRVLWPTTPEPFARLVLEASYEACVLAALDNRDRHDGMAGSKKLFLTLLGGDAFGNPQSWILDAIRRALRKFEHEDLDVFLVCYEGVDAGSRKLEEELDAMGGGPEAAMVPW